MNKKMIIGMGIFLVVLLSILSLSTTTDVNAQTILNNDTNIPASVISYQLELTELNLTNQYESTYDNLTNTTSMTNITHNIDYECTLFIDQASYTTEGYTLDPGESIFINQTLSATLSNGRYDMLLECLYYINTTNITSVAQGGENGIAEIINETIIDATLVLSSKNITTPKSVIIDSVAPIVMLENSVFILHNNTAYINLTITDVSDVSCTVNVYNQTLLFNTTNIGNVTTNRATLSISLTTGNHTLNLSCQDKLLNSNNTNHIIKILSPENLTNITNNTNTTSDTPYFDITLSKPEFGLGEMGYYTIVANNNSNVSLTICPIASGWVQCYMVPTFVNETFPKTQALPYTNKTGKYLIEGVMRYKNTTLIKNITYDTQNTLTATITASKIRGIVGDTITFNASATSGIAPYVYRWTMHDSTRFTGAGAYKKYNVAGTYRVNLTVNDSLGNNYTTYEDVIIKNQYQMTVVVTNKKDSSRLNGAKVTLGDVDLETNSNGIATFTLVEGSYDIMVSRENYKSYSEDITLDAAKTMYINLSFYDVIPPKITLLTANDILLNKNSVDLKFKAEDVSTVACSLYIAEANSSWYTLKDSGDNLLTNTQYTFEIRDLTNGAYKWKVECVDADSNKAYSDERAFIVSDGDVMTALQSSSQASDDINKALDSMNKLSGDESAVADVLSIKTDLKYLLDKITNFDRDIHDLSYRRDLDEAGRIEAQKNLTNNIAYLKNNTPIGLSVKDSKTFVKYVRDEDLGSLLKEYLSIKNMNIDEKSFLEYTKHVQSRVVISTRVRNVELYYLTGEIRDITVVSKEIKVAMPEDEASIKGSNSITFVEVIPKTVCQTVKQLSILNKEYTVLKDDPIIEYPADTQSIIYYIEGELDVDEFQNTDTILIDKNIQTIKSTTGMSVFGLNAISDIELGGRGAMIIVIGLLLLFYIVVNFDIVDRIRGVDIGFLKYGSKKKISFIRVLINDAVDYLKMEDYDKAALIYHEIKLSYEESNKYVRKQVYDESFDLCNQIDLAYAMKVLEKAEYYIRIQDRNSAILEFGKLENTYNRLSESYQVKIGDQFKKIMDSIRI